MSADQDQTIAFLSGRAERTIGTHLSVLFLTGDRALKLKRAVVFPYLDYSTVEKRRRACLDEAAGNHRTAPGLCRGVVALTRAAGGGLELDGPGEPIDWLVDMVRFPDRATLDRMAEDGRLGRPLIERLADRVAAFHAAAEPDPARGGRDGLAWIIDSNRDCFRLWGRGVVDDGAVETVFAAIRDALARHAELLEARRRAGLARHVHGDLHLGNVCLFNGEPMPFDGIEFNDTLSRVDVLYDFAFLVMDLEFRGLGELANAALNRYLDRRADGGGLPPLPLFLAVRAVVRAHVAAAEVARDPAAAGADAAAERARAYLDFAGRCLSPVRPALVAVGGLSGTGKTTVARALAAGLGGPGGARVARSDTLRKRLAGVAPEERLGAEGYGAEMTERTYAVLCDEARQALAAGRPVVADAVFARPAERAAIKAVAAAAGAPFAGFWLEAPLETRLERIGARTGDASDATVEVARAQEDFVVGAVEWCRWRTAHDMLVARVFEDWGGRLSCRSG